jgi:PAS domain S-box-containing protein
MKNLISFNKASLSRGAFIGRMTAGVLLLNLFVIALICVSLRQSRNHYEERAAIETRNLAQVLEQHIDGIIDKTDVVLFAAVEEFEHQFARGGVNRQQLKDFLNRVEAQVPELDRLMVIDDRGGVIYHTGTSSGTLNNVSDRDYFQQLRRNPGSGLFISKPIKSRISGKWVVILARRINLGDGAFAGIVCGSLSLDYFLQHFSSINVGPNGAIVLRDMELRVVARYPEPGGTGSTVGKKKVSSEIAELIRAGKKSGTYKATPPIDHIERTYSFRRLVNYPLHIIVGFASSDYLKEWRVEVVKMTMTAFLFLVVTLFSSWLVYQGWRSRNSIIRTLKEQEVKYRTVADYTYDWEYWIGPDGAFRYISPACKRVTGYDAEQFYEDPELFNRLLHPDDRELYATYRCEGLQGADSLVFRIVRADGAIRWLEHVCQPIVDEAGVFLGDRCCNRDITERKRVEQSLWETQFSVDHASMPIFWAGEGGRFFYVNRACGYLGYSREELLGMSVYDIDPDFTVDDSVKMVQVIRDKGLCTFERRHRTRQGVLIPVEVTVHDMQVSGKEFRVSYVRDISERKAAEEEIARSEQMFRAIFESARDAIFLIATDSHYIECNPAATEMFRCTKAELIKRNPQYYSPPTQPDGRDTEQRAEELIAAALAGNPQSFEWRHCRPDGSEFDAMVVLSLFELDNAPMLLAILRDISQRKSLEKQLYHAQKMESIGTLAGGVAHDFNNLLTVITGYGYMIKTRLAPDDPQMVMIDQILSSTDRAAQLTRGLLAFSRKQAIDPKPVELNDIVNRVEKLLRRLIGSDVELITTLAEKPLRLFADEGQLEQVLMNLATNARDAMPEGGSLIITTEEKREEHYSFHGLIKPGNYALIKVSDTGCGMDEQTRAKIFEPFFTTKELGRGTGLGLAIVYGIVKQHNGFINVYSEPGRGTSFIIHLPLISELIAPADAEVEPPPRGGTETILLTEDDAIVRTMAGSFLRDFGYRVIAAVDGEDALEKFAEHKQEIDLIILDVMMPKKNGGEVYKTVKAQRPDIDVLFVSGYAADIIRQKGILEEDIQFISKPVSPAYLLRKIREILDMKQQ